MRTQPLKYSLLGGYAKWAVRVPNAKGSLRSGDFLTKCIVVSVICPTSNVSIVNATVPKLRLNFGATYLRQFNVTSRGSIATVVCFMSRVSSFLCIKTYSSIMSGMFHSRFFFRGDQCATSRHFVFLLACASAKGTSIVNFNLQRIPFVFRCMAGPSFESLFGAFIFFFFLCLLCTHTHAHTLHYHSWKHFCLLNIKEKGGKQASRQQWFHLKSTCLLPMQQELMSRATKEGCRI